MKAIGLVDLTMTIEGVGAFDYRGRLALQEKAYTLFIVQYTWDRTKAASNLKKHGVSFEEAVSVLENPTTSYDVDNAKGEQRLLATGWSARARVLFVVCVERDENTLRIISARRANRAEVEAYEASQD